MGLASRPRRPSHKSVFSYMLKPVESSVSTLHREPYLFPFPSSFSHTVKKGVFSFIQKAFFHVSYHHKPSLLRGVIDR